MVMVSLHMHRYESTKNEFVLKLLKKARVDSKIHEIVNQKCTIGMCLFNVKTKKIEMSNEALHEMLGVPYG
jgi:hypothetical protein